jgi:ATPase subunit of ABC transporter with duplicated ATPase domains
VLLGHCTGGHRRPARDVDWLVRRAQTASEAGHAPRPEHQVGSHGGQLDIDVALAGERELLRDVRVTLQRGERVAICGANGAGKSTLLASLLGALNVPRDRVLYLAQDLPESEAVRCIEQVRALPRGERGRVCELLSALGAPPEAVLASRCPSPGEARKLVLAFGLGREVEALFLDEPTNHLDLPAIERLEEALLRYPGALVAVSHDQRFLERTTERKLQIDARRLV